MEIDTLENGHIWILKYIATLHMKFLWSKLSLGGLYTDDNDNDKHHMTNSMIA